MVGQVALLARAAYFGVGPAANGMLVMALLAWGVTFKYSVALHRKIADNHDVAGSVRLLVVTNWPRTVLWTLGGVILEFVGRLLGVIDFHVLKRNPYTWEVAESTKSLGGAGTD